MGHTEAFKEQMVKRMLGPPAVSASALSKQVDVPQPTLSQRPLRPGGGRRRRSCACWQRLMDCKASSSGPCCAGREGLHEEQLVQWRQSAMGALAPASSARPSGAQRRKVGEVQNRVKELERELRRKENHVVTTGCQCTHRLALAQERSTPAVPSFRLTA